MYLKDNEITILVLYGMEFHELLRYALPNHYDKVFDW